MAEKSPRSLPLSHGPNLAASSAIVSPDMPHGSDHGSWRSSRLIFFFLTWYISSSLGNNVAKAILAEAPVSMTVTMMQFASSIGFCYVLTRTGAVTRQPLTLQLAKTILPLSTGHVLAHLLTQISLAAISVSFSQTVKSTSPIFTLLLSRWFLKEKYDMKVALSLVPVVLGVCLSSAVEVEFNWLGLLTALASTGLFVCQNLYSKVLFTDGTVDHINLLEHTSLLAFGLLFPIWLIIEGPYCVSMAGKMAKIGPLIVLNGFCNFLQSFSAFSLLSLVSPLTYSVANTFKRVFVILTSILWFGNTVLPLNYFGIMIAFAGILLYNKSMEELKRREVSSKLPQ